MSISDEIIGKLKGYEFRQSVRQWMEQFKETPYVNEILSFLMRTHFDLPDEERWVTPYKLLKGTGVRGKDSFYRKAIPNLIELGILDFKEVRATPYSQTRRFVRLNDDFVREVICGIASFKEKAEEI